jgi:hypothetical protein
MPQKTADAISKSHELCPGIVEVRAETSNLIAEARQAIVVARPLSIVSIGWITHFAICQRVSLNTA